MSGIDGVKLKETVKKVNGVLEKLKIDNITEMNDKIYYGAAMVCEILGFRKKKVHDWKEPWWKKRLTTQIREMNKDLGRVNALIDKKTIKKRHQDTLERKYKIKHKGLHVAKEEIRQRIKAKTAKISRYQQRINQYQQNRMFRNNESRFYKQLNNDTGRTNENAIPDADESRKFWSDIWSNKVEHNREAEWMNDFKMGMEDTPKQQKVEITEVKVKKMLRKIPNWKAPGPDGVQGFWLKNFTSMHKYLTKFLTRCLEGDTPGWMTKGRTVLIQKDNSKGIEQSNYRPITCLPLVWKLLTGLISDEIYIFLESGKLLPEEQKGCKRKSMGTADLLFIDRLVLQEAGRRKKNLSMGWVDYRKAYDMVPHSWILECLNSLGISENIQQFLDKTMKTWRVELTCANQQLGEVKINRGIFQGDALSPLLFVVAMIPLTHVLRKIKSGYEFTRSKEKVNHVLYMDDLKLYAKTEEILDSLVQTVRVFSKDIGMQFGLDKCAVLTMKRGRVVKSDGIELPNDKKIRSLEQDDSYKYLGILQSNEIQRKEMKDKVGKEYKRRIRKILESKLNGGNIIKAINTWAIPILRYSAAFLDWTINDLQEMDRRTRKLMTMHNALHPRSNVDRLYIPRGEGGRGLLNVEDTVNLAKLRLQEYVKMSDERLVSAARGADEATNWEAAVESKHEFKKRTKHERQSNWKAKILHGQFIRQTEHLADEQQWLWVKDGTLKRETESLIMAAQEQAIRTNLIKAKIDKTQQESKCRICGQSDESVSHILSECSKMAQKEYKRRHDWVGKKVHWEVSKQCGFVVKEKWYEHEPNAVSENNDFHILWDFEVHTDHEIEARRPDMIVTDKKNNICKIIDFAVPFDSRVDSKEVEKIEKYQDLARELRKIWNKKVKVIPIIIGALGTTPKLLRKRLEDIDIDTKIVELQKSAILYSARILRKVLEV